MRRHRFALLLALSLALGGLPGDRALATTRVASGLNAPMFVAAPAGDSRLFIVERGGTVRILQNGAVLPAPFLDISDRVNVGGGNGEGGLLGLAFPSDFGSTRAFYVYYTTSGSPLTSRISRFRANAADPNVADDEPGQEKVLLSQEQPYVNHNGGTIAFGPDGMLYMGFGDGGDGGDPGDRAQKPDTLLGKMIRIDVSFSSFTDDYKIPNDNPFRGDDGVLDEIWAFGLRNPFRFSFDRQTGDVYIGDVGQNEREEIDVAPASSNGGENYGWDVMEGTACYNDPDGGPDPGEPACNSPALTVPAFEYRHSAGVKDCDGQDITGCAVTGGYVYRGPAPGYQGEYFFADYCSSKIYSLTWDEGTGTSCAKDRTDELKPPAGQGSIGSPVGFGEDGFGELYIVDPGGEVFSVPEPAQLLLAAVGAAVLAGVRRARRS